MKKLVIYYNFIVVTTMAITGFMGATNLPQLISAVLFFPLAFYFWLLVGPKKKQAISFPEIIPAKAEEKVIKLKKVKERRLDFDRRAFLKLIGTAGTTIFLFSIFTRKAQAAFFGSVPGPGTVGLKDSAGNLIDPAEKYPTDGYKINQLDDSSPSYYGFTNKDGAWFIMKEDATTGDYRYTKGDSDFTNATTGWPNRINLTYGYFEDIF